MDLVNRISMQNSSSIPPILSADTDPNVLAEERLRALTMIALAQRQGHIDQIGSYLTRIGAIDILRGAQDKRAAQQMVASQGAPGKGAEEQGASEHQSNDRG
jgi:hypothetical protein